MSAQQGILFDAVQCIGCGECYAACKAANKLDKTSDDPLKDHLSANTYTTIEDHNGTYLRKLCMHCGDPACVSVCPIGALVKTKEGPVTYDAGKCMGCRYCMQACPQRVPRYEWSSVTPRVRKCIMCHDRVAAGGVTACSEACATGATTFGGLEELKQEAYRRIKAEPDKYYQGVYGIQEAGGSNVLVISPVSFDQLGLPVNLPGEPLPGYTKRALEKIPAVVGTGSVLLTGLYWLTKRKNEVAREERLAAKGGRS